MKKRWIIMVMVLLLCVVIGFSLIACQNTAPSNDFGGGYSNGGDKVESTNDNSPIVTTTDRMMVYYVTINITIEEGGNQIDTVKSKLKEVGGYEQSSYDNDGYVRYVFRVPTEKLDEFVKVVSSQGEVKDRTVTSEDITEIYNTTLAKKNALQAEYDYLNDLLTVGGLTIEEALEVRKQLREVASELDAYNTSLSTYKKQADYSTVTVHFYEKGVYVEPSYWEELGQTLQDSGNSVGVFFGGILTAIVAILPYLGIIVGIFGLYVLIKFIVCKATKKPFTLFKKIREKIAYEKKRRQYYKQKTLSEINKSSNNCPPTHPTSVKEELKQTEINEEIKEENADDK